MSERTTSVRKSKSMGWKAETSAPLGFTIEDKPAYLEVRTYKDSHGIVTYAGVHTRDNGFTTTRVFRDFHKRVAVVDKRGTEKAITCEHQLVLGGWDDLVRLAKEHHAKLGDLAA